MVIETTAIKKNRDYLADWWFGTFYCIYWEQSSQLTFIFFRGVDIPAINKNMDYQFKNDPFRVDLPMKNGDFPLVMFKSYPLVN